MKSIIRTLGSLRFAITLIASLAILLGISTFTESVYGTPFAQKIFYNAGWFDIFLGFVWVNIFCATLTRWPFKKKHIGFVITHIGILTLLIGCLLTRLTGVEGQMTVFENEKNNHIIQQGYELKVTSADNKNFKLGVKNKSALSIPGLDLQVTQFIPHAATIKSLIENPKADSNHAVQATIASDAMGLHEDFVLIENDPLDPESSSQQIGPANFSLKTQNKSGATDAPILFIIQKKTEKHFKVLLLPSIAEINVPGSDFKISNLRYYPNARVEKGQIINVDDKTKFNPAVEFVIKNSQGQSEHHTKFMLFPDFGSLRGGVKNNVFDLEIKLMVLPQQEASNSPAFTFQVDQNNEWSYEIRSSKVNSPAKPLVLNEKIQTGWMDLAVTVHKVFNNVQISKTIREDKNSNTPAVQIKIKELDGSYKSEWLSVDESSIETNNHFNISFLPQSVAMPFTLTLKDFRKKDYPGTRNPASFESDVRLEDSTENLVIEKTIQMNKPLDYKGWRIFQSSYIQDEEHGEASVFTIAKNPGIFLIYPGAVIILIGVIMLFYLHPFFKGN